MDLHEQPSPHPRLQAAELFQQREVEARLQPRPRLGVTEHTRHMSSESVRPYSSLTPPPLLCQLHWLPVRHRVSYKIAELTFKALHVDLSPPYLQQCVQIYSPARSLRSASSYTLVQSRSHSAAGDCTFVHAAATVWNALPVSVTSKDSLLSFKSALKTHLCASL